MIQKTFGKRSGLEKTKDPAPRALGCRHRQYDDDDDDDDDDDEDDDDDDHDDEDGDGDDHCGDSGDNNIVIITISI